MDGLATAVLLLICSCAYIRPVPALSAIFLRDKSGFFGTFYKGTRLIYIYIFFIIFSGAQATLARFDSVLHDGDVSDVLQVIV